MVVYQKWQLSGMLMRRWKLLSNRNDTPVSDPTNRRSPNDEEEKEGAGDQQEQEVGGHLELVVGRHQEILRNRWSTSGRNLDQELLRNRRRLSGTCWRTSGTGQNRNCCWSSEVVNGERVGNQDLPGFNNISISSISEDMRFEDPLRDTLDRTFFYSISIQPI